MRLILLTIFLVVIAPNCWGIRRLVHQDIRNANHQRFASFLTQGTQLRQLNVRPRRMPSSDAVIFPTDSSTTTTESPFQSTDANVTSNEIPVSVVLEMSEVATAEEFVKKFGTEGDIMMFNARTFDTSIPFATQAVCTPQPTTVPIDKGDDSYVVYFPSCTRIERCGGCCPHELLKCYPTKTESVNLQVVKSRYLGPGGGFDVAEPETVSLERHLECKCQCRVQASHCKHYQIYRPNECRCECLNQEEASSCSEDKFWDTDLCACRCREIMDCSTGFVYNRDTCSCVAARVSRTGVYPAFREF